MTQAILNKYKKQTIDATPDREGYINYIIFYINEVWKFNYIF